MLLIIRCFLRKAKCSAHWLLETLPDERLQLTYIHYVGVSNPSNPERPEFLELSAALDVPALCMLALNIQGRRFCQAAFSTENREVIL